MQRQTTWLSRSIVILFVLALFSVSRQPALAGREGPAAAATPDPAETLAPVGATPAEPFTQQAVYDAAAQIYRFTYHGSDTIVYAIPLTDWALQRGLIRVNAQINGGPVAAPLAWAGPAYFQANGNLLGGYRYATLAQTTLVGHSLTDGVATLNYSQTYEGTTLTRAVRFWLQGRTLVFRDSGGTHAGTRNYAGFDFDRSDNTPGWQILEFPFLPDPVVAFGGLYFYSTYLDRSLSSSITFEKVVADYSPSSVYAATYSRTQPDSAGHIVPLDETAYVTLSDDVMDVLPQPRPTPSAYRTSLSARVVLDLWRSGIGNGRFDPIQRDVARIWQSPAGGTAQIYGTVRDLEPNCGDGVIGRVLQNERTLWAYAIANGDTTGSSFTFSTAVNTGDRLIFRLERRDNDGCDSTYFAPTIVLNGQTYHALDDFRSTQGYRGWTYEEYDGTHYAPMTWDTTINAWHGTSTYSRLWADGGHPGAGGGVANTWAANTGLLQELHAYGLHNLAVIYHDWQRYGYDVKLPSHYPANPAYGTPAEFRTLVDSAQGYGWLFAPHQNYVDMYPSGPLFDLAAVAKDAALHPKLGWFNTATGEQAYLIAADKSQPYAQAQGVLIAGDYHPNAAYLDVDTGWQPATYLDMDAANPTAKSFATAVTLRKALFRHQQGLAGGPLLGEGGEGPGRYDTFYAGYVDGVERQIEGRRQALVIPDHELTVIRPLMVNHGLGYYGRYFVETGQGEVDPSEADWDQYRATEIAFGHAGFISDGLAATDPTYPMGSLAQVMTEYNLLQPLQSQYLADTALSVRYRQGTQMLSLSQAIQAGVDFANAQVLLAYANGLDIAVNRSAANFWTVALGGRTFNLPPSGWAAINPGLGQSAPQTGGFLAYSAAGSDGTRVDYVRAPRMVFARSRGGLPRMIEDLTTDGTAGLAETSGPGRRDVHLVAGTLVNFTGAPYGVLSLTGRTSVTLNYQNANRFRLRVEPPVSGSLTTGLTYRDAPADWRDGQGNLPAPASHVIRMWRLDRSGSRSGPVLAWSTTTGKDFLPDGAWSGDTFEVYRMCPFGDVTDDNQVTVADIQWLAGQWAQPVLDPLADLNVDNVVDVLDVMLASAQWPASCP